MGNSQTCGDINRVVLREGIIVRKEIVLRKGIVRGGGEGRIVRKGMIVNEGIVGDKGIIEKIKFVIGGRQQRLLIMRTRQIGVRWHVVRSQ